MASTTQEVQADHFSVCVCGKILATCMSAIPNRDQAARRNNRSRSTVSRSTSSIPQKFPAPWCVGFEPPRISSFFSCAKKALSVCGTRANRDLMSKSPKRAMAGKAGLRSELCLWEAACGVELARKVAFHHGDWHRSTEKSDLRVSM